MKLGCSICIFLSSANLIEVQISQRVSEGPFDFEITRVDSTYNLYDETDTYIKKKHHGFFSWRLISVNIVC